MCNLKVFYWGELESLKDFQKYGFTLAIANNKKEAVENIIKRYEQENDNDEYLNSELNETEPEVFNINDYAYYGNVWE